MTTTDTDPGVETEVQYISESEVDHRNLDSMERTLSLLVGGAMILYGLVRRSFFSTVLATLGGVLFYRGATGHCHVYEAVGINRNPDWREDDRQMVATKPEPDDVVEEASWESFPASDSPAWTGVSIVHGPPDEERRPG